jgi:hypothetical protein
VIFVIGWSTNFVQHPIFPNYNRLPNLPIIKHDLCYWMINKLCTTSNFSRLQQTPKFTDNQRIIFVHICVHSFCRCYKRFGAYPNYTHIKIFVKTTYECFSIKQQHRLGLMLGLVYLMPYCWLEVSLHSEHPATGQLDQGFPWSQNKCWVGAHIPHCTECFTCSPPNGNIKNFALM